MALINLHELAKRENERVEWKENVGDIEDIVKTAVAFANDYSNLGGGYIVCGAKEGKDEYGFQKLFQAGLTSDRLKEIEGKFFSEIRNKVSPPFAPISEEIQVSESRRILIFIIAATSDAHSYRASGKDSQTFYVRIGRETREAKNSILMELLLKKNEIEPWDKRINTHSKITDIDLLAMREYLKEMGCWDTGKSIEDYLSDVAQISTFVPPLVAKEKLSNQLKPKNFSLLFFSNDPLRFYSGTYAILSVYNGKDRSEPTGIRHEISGNIVFQTKTVLQILQTELYTVFKKNKKNPNQTKYSSRVLEEAVVNAIVHRDYQIDQPVRITIFNDRIEIHSPGSLPKAIDKEKFIQGKATPFWRNQTLSYFFNKLKLAQGEGQGIPTIFRITKEEGYPEPQFEIGSESVTCILRAKPGLIFN